MARTAAHRHDGAAASRRAARRWRKSIWPAALQKCEADAALRARLADLIKTVRDKLPGGMAEDASATLDLDSILAEARALALGRSAEI